MTHAVAHRPCSTLSAAPDVIMPPCLALSAVVLYFAVVADVSIASLNLSLLVNSVGFYQVSACAGSS
jgi:hypothetical protein